MSPLAPTSLKGRKEHTARNNHGSWYLVQAMAIARFLVRDDVARAVAREDFDRIGWQIEPDGQQPMEIVRTDGLSYSGFNLAAQFQVAWLAATPGVDLWNHAPPRGGGLKQALACLKPFDPAPEKWPHHQHFKRGPGFRQPLFEMATRLDAVAKHG